MELSVPITSTPTAMLQSAETVYCYGDSHPIVAVVFICLLFVFTYPRAWLHIPVVSSRETRSSNTPPAPSVNRVIFHQNVIEEEYRYILNVIYIFFIPSNLKISATRIYLCGREMEL